MNSKRGKLVVISSPSGGGKTTVIHALLEKNPELKYSVSATTRPPRAEEKDGKDYFFISADTFQERIREGAFLEWAYVHGYMYGTLRSQIEKFLDAGKTVLLDIDVQGGLTIKQNFPDALLLFLLPPSMDVLRTRLKGRGTESGQTLQTRIENAKQEISAAEKYDHRIVNDRFQDTLDHVRKIIENQTTKRS